MKKITPSLGVNWEQFGKASSLPGLLLARDVIDEQIRILQGDIQEPEEEDRETTTLDEQEIVSLRGLTGRAREEARRHNMRVYSRRYYHPKKKAKGSTNGAA